MSNKPLLISSLVLALSFPLFGAQAAPTVTIDELNKMSQAQYEQSLDKIFEKAPWAIKQAGQKRPYKGFVDMYEGIIGTVKGANYETQLALIQSHPDLACKGIRGANIAQHSQNEQSGAGLNECTQQEADLLKNLNKQYKQKFGFPFMLAVKGYNKAEIIDQFQKRINNNKQQEFDTALQQVYKVIMWRLLDTAK